MATSGTTLAGPDRTVLDRLLQAGIAKDRAMNHLRDGWVRVDGQIVTDSTQSAPPPTRVELRFSVLSEASGS